ncbi:MAG: hypothetical protein WD767_11390 [Alphaproteobacteria bacterium]
MSGYEAIAPLTGTLLSSKGAAAPSNSVASLMDDFAVEALATARPSMRPALSPRGESAKPQQAGTGAYRNGSRVTPQPVPKAVKGAAQERIKLSLRLDAEQHLRLKLAAAHLRLSSQALLMTALDDYLANAAVDIRDGQCACLMSGALDPTAPCRGKRCGNAG